MRKTATVRVWVSSWFLLDGKERMESSGGINWKSGLEIKSSSDTMTTTFNTSHTCIYLGKSDVLSGV